MTEPRTGGFESEIGVEELKTRLDNHEDIFLLDVREQREFELCNIGGTLIPLGQLAARINELDASKEIVVLCRSGRRSGTAVGLLRRAGFEKVRNIAGGILAWAEKIDPSIPKY